MELIWERARLLGKNIANNQLYLRIYWKIFLKVLTCYSYYMPKRMSDFYKPIEVRDRNSFEKL